ncbi:MAG: hypothetical protein ACOCUU_00885 [Nanoarchaeota archaeon]
MLDTYISNDLQERKTKEIDESRRKRFQQALQDRDYSTAQKLRKHLPSEIVCYHCTYHLDTLVAEWKRKGRGKKQIKDFSRDFSRNGELKIYLKYAREFE